MLTCRDLVNNADLLLDNAELTTGQRLSLRTHLLICHRCRRYLRQLRVLTDHLRLRDPGPADDARVQAVLRRVDHHRA